MITELHYFIGINAEAKKIWKFLWDDTSYRTWASVFFEGSYLLATNWNEGSKIHFLSPDKSGIYSIIETHVRNNIISFKHIGLVKDGEELPLDRETKKWSGATETYSISKESDNHILTVNIDVMDEHLEFMKTKLPEALEVIKKICEK